MKTLFYFYLVIITTLICWYSRVGYSHEVIVKDKVDITYTELIKYGHSVSYDKDYTKQRNSIYSYTRTWIPFVYNDSIIKQDDWVIYETNKE